MKRSKFNLSHTKLLSCDMGQLVPIGLIEVLPGDSMQLSTTALVRLAPMMAPVMHPVQVRIHHWFVPHRLVWENWEEFITGGPDGMNASEFPTIQHTTVNGGIGQPMDYYGVTPHGGLNNYVSALPFRGYNLIWNEFYRDQDLQVNRTTQLTDGVDFNTYVTQLGEVGWEKDYFTSARPWEQKGPTVSIPLVGSAPIKGIGQLTPHQYPLASNVVRETGQSGAQTTTYPFGQAANVTGSNQFVIQGTGNPGFPMIYADLTNVSAVTVNQLRQSLALQRFEEARARYGSRYSEYLAHLGVKSSDARLQRPEYLGGGRQTLQFSEVLQTAEGTDPVGQMRGHGITGVRSNRFRRFFEEHGYVHSLMSIRPKTIYSSGIPRTFNRRTKTDFWQKELQHIGQQQIQVKEIWSNSGVTGVFGYQDRYDDYRRMESSIAGEFRSTELDFWHLARTAASQPALNASFITCVPSKRIFAAQDNDTVYVQARHSCVARRLIARTGESFTF